MSRIHLLATRDQRIAVEQIESVVPRLTGRLVPIGYDALFRQMTPAYWWYQVKESYWDIAKHGWSSPREILHGAGSLSVHGLRYLQAPRRPDPGAYIFADLDHLSAAELQKAAIVWQALAEPGTGARLLNHPTRSMRRYELLRALHERGINRFDVFRLTEARWPARYPVFLRREDGHAGPSSGLLRTREELEMVVEALERQGEVRDRLMVVEFCDTADADGIYRKYGAWVVGDQVFANSVMFSRSWLQKHRDLDEPELLQEERRYVEENPHEDALREIFGLARIDYGRMDYGLLHGKIQVWEINTYPTVAAPPARRTVERQPIRAHFARRLASALERLTAS
jgi:hypothetical protein